MPCFDNTIHDICWLPNGENFIVIAGVQPAIATLYDKNCTPLFEFGKRYRNTIRVCPFSQIVMLGGFGNLKGEIDFWDLAKMTQINDHKPQTKSDCAVGISFAPDGVHLLTSVLYERLKVDNMINLFTPSGKRLLGKGQEFAQLQYVAW